MDNDGVRWRKEQRHELCVRIIRWCCAIPLLFSFLLLGPLAPFFMLLGCILIAPDIAGYFSRFVGNILWSRRKGEPTPVYGIPESLVARGKYAEAEEEYEKIIQEFPNEVKPHVDMINIAVRWLNDGQLAEELYRRGMGLLKNQADRDKLTESYTAMLTRLKRESDADSATIPIHDLKEARERLVRDRRKYWR